MPIDQRKAEILNQMFQVNITNLISNLAAVIEENEGLRAKVAELEKKPAAAAEVKAEAAHS